MTSCQFNKQSRQSGDSFSAVCPGERLSRPDNKIQGRQGGLVEAEPLAHSALDVIAAHGALVDLLAYHQPYSGMSQAVWPGVHLKQRVAARLPQTKNG